MDKSKYPFRAICCVCKQEIAFRLSIAMQCGNNTGCFSCPQCKTFLHVEITEGDRAWTERFSDYAAREVHGPSPVAQLADMERVP